MRRDEAVSWRASALDAMLRALSLAGPAILLMGILLRKPAPFDLPFFLILATVIVMVALRFARGLPFGLRAAVLVGVMVSACIVFVGLTGFSLGAAAGLCGGIVTSGVLLGRRVALSALAVTAVSVIAFGFANTSGVLTPSYVDTDPHLFTNWFRMALSFALLTGALTAAVDYVVRHVETKYAELYVAYDSLAELHRKLETAKEEERRFIARELHDDLGQALTVLKLGLKTGKSMPFSDPVRVVDGLIVKVRELSRALRPALLDEVGLVPALGVYLEEQSAVSGVALELDTSGFVERLPGDLEIACFRLVQEAVTNALRHAEAKRVTVHIERGTKTVRLRIEDDGNGSASPEALARAGLAGHVGVVGMRERVRALDGSFEISAAPGKGTSIRAELPLAATPSERAPSEV